MTVIYGPDGKPISVVVGNVAHDAVDSGNPVKIGGVAVAFDAMPADVAVDDRVQAAYTPKGVAAVALFRPDNSLPVTDLPVTVSNEVTVGASDNNIGNVDVVTLPGVAGDIANDAADSGNPVKIGGYSSTNAPATTSADGDRANAWFSRFGSMMVTLRDGAGNDPAPNGLIMKIEDNPMGAVGSASGWLSMGRASAAAPTAVSADADAVAAWFLRNGAIVNQLSAAGALIGGDATNGLDVDVTRLPALVAGTANIGDVDVASIAAGDNNIGNVDVVTLPALVAGSANIGDVDVLTLPGVAGTVAHDSPDSGNPVKIGGKATSGTPAAVASGDRVDAWFSLSGAQIVNGDVAVTALPALVAGSANIGDVDVASIAAGDNNIGNVDVVTLPGVAGDVANDAVDSGNPIKMGGKAESVTPEAVADGDRVDAWFDTRGRLSVFIGDANGNTDVQAGSVTTDGMTSMIGLAVKSQGLLYNGATWDRQRGDITNGLDVDVTRLPALVAGTANIGDVDVLTHPSVPTATLTNVADAATSAQLLASNAARKGCIMWNDSTEDLFIKYGTTAALTDCTVKIPVDAQWSMPTPIYTGRIDGIWRANASGSVRITEL